MCGGLAAGCASSIAWRIAPPGARRSLRTSVEPSIFLGRVSAATSVYGCSNEIVCCRPGEESTCLNANSHEIHVAKWRRGMLVHRRPRPSSSSCSPALQLRPAPSECNSAQVFPMEERLDAGNTPGTRNLEVVLGDVGACMNMLLSKRYMLCGSCAKRGEHKTPRSLGRVLAALSIRALLGGWTPPTCGSRRPSRCRIRQRLAVGTHLHPFHQGPQGACQIVSHRGGRQLRSCPPSGRHVPGIARCRELLPSRVLQLPHTECIEC